MAALIERKIHMDIKQRLTLDTLDDNGCINVLCALLRQISREFRQAYKEHLADPLDQTAYAQYRDLKKEIKSNYFHSLTRLDGGKVVDRLEKDIAKELKSCA